MKRDLKKFGAIALIVVLCVSFAAPSLAAQQFTDIPTTWAKDAVEYAIKNGILVGFNGKINPNDSLIRAQMVAMVNRAFGSLEKADISRYTDIPSNAWYVDDLAKAVKMEIIFGNGAVMKPEDNITREQAFAILARALKLSSTDYTALDHFTDKGQIADMFKGELSALAAGGYIVGNDNILNPKENITRAQFAQVMYNIIKEYINKAGTYLTVADGSIMVNVSGVTLKDVTITGDLILGDGIGTGDVTLDNVKVSGRTVIRGGGNNSIHVINGSVLTGTVIIDNVNNEVRIVTESGTTVQKIEAGSDIVLEGQFTNVTVIGEDAQVTVKGQVANLVVEAPDADIIVEGSVTKVETSKEATGTTISGNGKVSQVTVNANNVAVNTANTTVSVGSSVTGTTAGNVAVEAGTTAVTDNSGSGIVSPGIPGGSSGGSSDPSTPSNPVASVALVTTTGGQIISSVSGSNYTIDLSGTNENVFINGFKVNSTPAADKLMVVGYEENNIIPTDGIFQLAGNNSLIESLIGFPFDGNVSVKTMREIVDGSISKDIKVYSGDTLVQQIKLTIKVSAGSNLDLTSSILQHYNMTVSGKKHTAVLKSGSENVTLGSTVEFYYLLKSIVTVSAGYTYEGVTIGVNDDNYTDPPTNNDLEIIANLKEKLGVSKGATAITLGELTTGEITVRMHVEKDSQEEIYTVLFK